jgi:PAS domain S-box-containing protein
MNPLTDEADASIRDAAQQRFAGLVLDSIDDGFYVVDGEWRIVYANRRACAAWKAPAESVIGRVLWERFPQAVGSEGERHLRAAAASPALCEFEAFSPVAVRWHWVRVAPLADGLVGVYWRDVTDRRNAEDALRDSKERFAAMLEALPQIAFVIRPDGTAEYYNRRFTDYVGHAVGADPDSRTELQHPDDREALVQARRAGAASDNPYRVEARLRRHDGAYRWHVVSNTPLRRDGKTVAWLGTAVDIDDARRAEETLRRVNEELEQRVAGRTRDLAEAIARLRASEESQRALFREAPVAMHALDATRRIIDVNRRWLELLGYEHDEVIGRPIADFYLAGHDSAHEARWRDLLMRGDLRQVERSFIAKSGATIDALVSVHLQLDAHQRFVRTITVVADMTARKQAEAAAQREREFSALLVENSIDAIIGLDASFRYTVWNPAMEAMSGTPKEAALGRSLYELRPDIIGTPVEAAWRAALDGQRTALHDRPYQFPQSGRSGFYDADFAPLYGPDGRIVGGLAFLRDITQRRLIEDQLRHAQKMEAIGQLTGGVAHDFNNIMTVIMGNLDNLQRYLPDVTEPQRMIVALRRAATRAANLTHRLLAFARRQPLEPEPIDVNRLVTGMWDLLRRTLGEGIAVETALPGELWRILADPSELESALLNLAVNGRDAMPMGGTLTIAAADVRLDAGEAAAQDVAPGDYVLIAVSDTGIGMTPAILARAFEPFFTTKEVGQGSGLGLPQVYGFVKQSGGQVKIESTPGCGTTVRLYLPRLGSGDRAGDMGGDAPETSAQRPDATILVVEDDDDVRRHAVGILRELGYRVVEAADGPAALRLLGAEPRIDLLFADVVLPGGLDGHALAERARALRPGLKVLLTTGYVRSTDGEAGLIPKPFTHAGLAARIGRLLE